MSKIRLRAVSKDRYRASADERRRYGGDTVTEFYVTRMDLDETRVFTGYGPTPGERKTFALKKAAEFWGLLPGSSATPNEGSNFFVWVVNEDDTPLEGEGPYGPYGWRQAKDFARIGAKEGEHDRIVTEGKDPERFKLRRRYQAGTGAILARS